MKTKKMMATLLASTYVVVLAGCGGSTGKGYAEPEDAAIACIEAMSEINGEKLLTAVPEEVIKSVLDYSDLTEAKLIEKLELYIKEEDSDWHGDLEYKVVDVEYDNSVGSLGDVEDELYEDYGIKVKVEECCDVDIEAEVDGEDMSSSQDLMKIDGKWYTSEMVDYLQESLEY